MATLVSEPLRHIAVQWENHCGYSSAVLSGIVPDSRHLDNGGYHCAVEDLRRYGNAGDYSNTRPDDRNFNAAFGAAVDVSMSPADMKKCHDRLRKVWADKTDPRRKYINCINTWDGSGDAVRLDFYAGTATYASPDHKWHNHGEVRRRYLLDMTAAKAIVSALKGETKAQHLSSIGLTPGPTTTEDDMTPEQAKQLAELHAWMKTTGWADSNRALALLRCEPARYTLPGDKTPQVEPNKIAELLNGIKTEVGLLAGRDFTDEPAIVQGVLAGLNAEAIAAAIPPTMAQQVADELTRRLSD